MLCLRVHSAQINCQNCELSDDNNIKGGGSTLNELVPCTLHGYVGLLALYQGPFSN